MLRLFDCTVLLVDNGSVRPGATLGMRRISHQLESLLRIRVLSTSWRYADRIDKSLLDEEAAIMFPKAIEMEKSRFVVILPLFLGPSAIVTRDIPKLLNRSTQLIASPLVDLDAEACDITTLLANATLASMNGKPLTMSTKVLLVDHGSPKREVNRIRRALAARLRSRLYPATVVDCSMERREEPEYDFNEPTLQNAFDLGGFDRGEVIVVPAFLFPGNHAGPGGDIETIIAETVQKKQFLTVRLCRLIMDEANDEIVIRMLERNVIKALL
jgi:sirohydrochlorin ferrochelatase